MPQRRASAAATGKGFPVPGDASLTPRLEHPTFQTPDADHSCEMSSCCKTSLHFKAAGLNTAETGPGSSLAKQGPGSFTGGERSTSRSGTAQPPALRVAKVLAGHGLGNDGQEHSAFDTTQQEGAVLHPAPEMLRQTKGAVPARGSGCASEGLWTALALHLQTQHLGSGGRCIFI